MNGTIPSDPSWCSYCIRSTHGPCSAHRASDGSCQFYHGKEVYQPSSFVLTTVGNRFVGPDGIAWLCFGYDPRTGFWLSSVDQPTQKTNVSERAIGRTFHQVRMTHAAWRLLHLIHALRRLPTSQEAEAEAIILPLASQTLRYAGYLQVDDSLSELGLQKAQAYQNLKGTEPIG